MRLAWLNGDRDVWICSKCQSEHSDVELGLHVRVLILESRSQRIDRVAHLAQKTLLQFQKLLVTAEQMLQF